VPDRIADPVALALPQMLAPRGSRSFVFALNGGLGDLCLSLNVALEIRHRFSAALHHQWVLALATPWFNAMKPLAQSLGVFDLIVDLADAEKLPKALAHRPHLLPSLLAGHDLEARLGRSSVADHLWSSWGMAGRFELRTHARPIERLRKELRGRRKSLGHDERRYVLLAPESTYLGHLKAWPSWVALGNDLAEAGYETIVCAREDTWNHLLEQGLDPASSHHFDHGDPKLNCDLRNVASLVDGAIATVSLDSGSSHLASLLRVPCISLWGPTSPAIYASPANVVLRASLCPPCSADDDRVNACKSNACMQAIEPEMVLTLIQRISQQRKS
jgi:hypothetical protein